MTSIVPTVSQILATMDYGPAPESAGIATRDSQRFAIRRERERLDALGKTDKSSKQSGPVRLVQQNFVVARDRKQLAIW